MLEPPCRGWWSLPSCLARDTELLCRPSDYGLARENNSACPAASSLAFIMTRCLYTSCIWWITSDPNDLNKSLNLN